MRVAVLSSCLDHFFLLSFLKVNRLRRCLDLVVTCSVVNCKIPVVNCKSNRGKL